MRDSSKAGLRILITNSALALRAGTELYVRDLAVSLMKRGHFPVAYSPILGDVAAELRRATVPVISDLSALNTVPDIIHGHHHLETMTALMHFSETPGVYVCHGWLPWEELPPLFPTIRRYVAVDDLTHERLLTTPRLDASLIETVYNFVDIARFRRRGQLPDRPKSVLIFSNYASGSLVENEIRAGCRRFFGIEKVDVVGSSSGNVVAEPEGILGKYDVVFAKGRAAIEALASGCAVIVADFAGLGGLVTSENLQRFRRLNFGVRTMQAAPLTDDTVLAQLQLYNSQDAARVTDNIRAIADMDSAIDKWESIYEQVIDDWPAFRAAKGTTLPAAQLAAGAEYMSNIGPVIKGSLEAQAQIRRLSAEKADLEGRLVRAVQQATAAKALRTSSAKG